MRKQERTGSKHQVKNSLKSIDFLALHNKLGLASDTQDSDSGSSGREQSSSEHDQLRNHEKHGNTANQHLPGHTEHPVGAFSLEHEHNMWKYNKNAVGLSEKHSENACRNFHCKRGKVCHADKEGKPHCICQDPAACPPTKDYEHVCGTDNKTYDGTCQLFGTKCQLEGTKIGRQLHLDYMGFCKYIPPCTDYEVDQFPLRMRDWLKNILIQFYERDLNTSGILTEKQRNKVKKIYQNDKRLVAGDHPVELLLHDFEKNYHMYVYPVHWQFHQLDQHPVDRLLTHSELAPLRASLVPMEHCITRFFQECDGDKDKLIALKEWCHCFGIKEGKPKRIGRCA
uniref:SPARC like 1 n=1 Tax=Junco hyemalis TaxID=40217 RepID=A0A8C5IPN7_JUNHY